MPHSYTPGNALYNQKLAEVVKHTVAKYHSDPPAGYWMIWENRYNIGLEIHSTGSPHLTYDSDNIRIRLYIRCPPKEKKKKTRN